MLIVFIIFAVIAAFAAILLVNAARVKPTPARHALPPTAARGSDAAVERFREMLRIPTVWDRENPHADHEPFDRFVPRMRELYPRVFGQLELEMVNTYGILLAWKGTDPELAPVVLMAHHDVVSADPAGWTHDPFAADIEDGRIWARGSVDNKALLACLYESTEMLLSEGHVPKRTIYLWSSNCEEDNGDTTPLVVELFKERGIHPALVLDEGGAVIDNAPLGVENEFAIVGLSEKGILNAFITVEADGGHASTPSPNDSTARLVAGLNRIRTNPHPFRMSSVLDAMLRELAAYAGFGYRLVFGNLWLFRPLVVHMLKNDPETAAMLHTTTAITELEGAPAANIIPRRANATVNMRIDPRDTPEAALARVREAFEGDVAIRTRDGIAPSPISPGPGDAAYEYIRDIVHAAYPDAGMAPYIQVSSSDARHFHRAFPRVYRFAGILFRGDQRTRIHGQDENLDVESFKRGVGFYYEFIRNLDRFGE
ncbi:M20/M25/M40 family metallo-hydrolase [Slackia exigua]